MFFQPEWVEKQKNKFVDATSSTHGRKDPVLACPPPSGNRRWAEAFLNQKPGCQGLTNRYERRIQ
jgi:hypothetical protein